MYLIHDFVGMIKLNKGIYISALMGRLLKSRTLVWVQTCLFADLALCAAAISSAYPAYVAGYTCRIKYSTTLFLPKTLCAYFFRRMYDASEKYAIYLRISDNLDHLW